jgi:uncharacterized protein (TIGR03086 family)
MWQTRGRSFESEGGATFRVDDRYRASWSLLTRGQLPGAATGAERLKIRMYDLLAHGWDLAQALGRPADLPEDAAEESLAFARADGRAVRPGGGCFGPARHVADAAPAILRLVAFLGRDVSAA